MDIGLEIALKNIGVTVSEGQLHIRRMERFWPFDRKRIFGFDEIKEVSIGKSEFTKWERIGQLIHKYTHFMDFGGNNLFVEKEYLDYDLLYDLKILLKNGTEHIYRVKHFDLRKIDEALEEINAMLKVQEQAISPQ